MIGQSSGLGGYTHVKDNGVVVSHTVDISEGVSKSRSGNVKDTTACIYSDTVGSRCHHGNGMYDVATVLPCALHLHQH